MALSRPLSRLQQERLGKRSYFYSLKAPRRAVWGSGSARSDGLAQAVDDESEAVFDGARWQWWVEHNMIKMPHQSSPMLAAAAALQPHEHCWLLEAPGGMGDAFRQ